MRIQPATFGRRGTGAQGMSEAPPVLIAASGSHPPEPTPDPASTTPDTLMMELRTLCLSKLDPNSIANTAPEVLIPEVELLIAEIANERRINLNGREQRKLAIEIVDDMLGLGPLEPLLDDETINDIMVNGPNITFVERRGKVYVAPVKFRDTSHLINVCQRIAAAVGRRVDEF